MIRREKAARRNCTGQFSPVFLYPLPIGFYTFISNFNKLCVSPEPTRNMSVSQDRATLFRKGFSPGHTQSLVFKKFHLTMTSVIKL